MPSAESPIEEREPGRPSGPLQIFIAFTQISVSGFGGTLFWAHRILVTRRRWLTEREFVEVLAVGQLLPGPNVLNLAMMLGKRFAGYRGAAAALAGFMGWPFLIVIAIGALYERYGGLPRVQEALAGMSAVAAGLLFASGLKMTSALPRRVRPWLFLAAAFVAVGLMRWPLVGVLAVLAPLGMLTGARER